MFERLDSCPVCTGEEFKNHMICEDFTVSSEKFVIVKCQQCGFLFTNPRPSSTGMDNYYQSKNYISHSNRSTNPVNAVYKIARYFTLRSKMQLVNQLSPKGQLLDIGCGTGHFLSAAKKEGWKITGVEPDENARNLASRRTGTSVHPRLVDLEEANKKNIITLWHVLEHVPDINIYIEQIKALLTPKGKVIIALPNNKSYDAELYKEFWAGYDVPRHLYHFDQASLTRLIKNHGLKVKQTLPMKLDAFYVSLLSETYKKSGWKKYQNALTNGWQSNKYASENHNNYSSLIYVISK